MNPSRSILALAAVSSLVAGLALFGCSKSKSPTNPYSTVPSGSPGGGATSFDSGAMSAPADFVHTFPTAGTIGYHCTFHVSMGMTGTVLVADGAADSAVVVASGTSFTPSSVSIKPGAYVHWTVTGGTHTVTSN
jgi:plastocyanin